MPAAREDNDATLADSALQQRRLAVVEVGNRFRSGGITKNERAVLPKMDFSEVAVAGIGEWGEEGMREINFTEQKVIARCRRFGGQLDIIQKRWNDGCGFLILR